MRRLVLLLASLSLSACAPAIKAQAKMVDNLRIQEATRNFETAQRAGDPLDICVKAKLVAAAYDDARETVNAEAWRAREHEACDLAAASLGVRRGGR
jgi:hypothetical protein